MPIVGLSLEQTREYQSRYDPDKGTPNATRWRIKTLDSRVMGRLRDLATTMHVDPSRPDDEVETSVNMEDVNFQTVQFGVEWDGLLDDKNQPIECKLVGRRLGGKSYRIVDPEVLCRVPIAVIRELAEQVRKDNELEEAERGNS